MSVKFSIFNKIMRKPVETIIYVSWITYLSSSCHLDYKSFNDMSYEDLSNFALSHHLLSLQDYSLLISNNLKGVI